MAFLQHIWTDLNIDKGQIEIPFKPMIRLGKPIFNSNNQKIGITIVNYNAANLFDKLRQWTRNLSGELSLLNRDGFWLHAKNQEDEWGFMFPDRKEISFAVRNSAIWNNAVSIHENG